MLIVPIEQAEPGMTLAADVPHPSKPDQTLLRRGFVLEPAILGRLPDLGVLALYVDYPGLAELDRHLAPALSPERLRIFGQVKSTIAAVQKTARPTVGFADYYSAIHEFSVSLFRQGDHPVFLDQIAARMGDLGVAHATSVAHLALVLGIRLQTYLVEQRRRLPARHASEVVNLGIAGMLHDIGKARLPEHLMGHSGTHLPENPEEFEHWAQHPQLGYEMIRGGVESSAAAAVLQHHEHFDGSGFPEMKSHRGHLVKMQGQNIHIFARVVFAADLFDQITHPDSNTRRPSILALHLMRTRYSQWLDPRVLDAMALTVPPFPPGGKVQLSDGTNAVVTALGQDPYRPTVRRFSGEGRQLEPAAITLANSDLRIEAVDGIRVDDMVPAERTARSTASSADSSEKSSSPSLAS